jgi:hypothetical protein
VTALQAKAQVDPRVARFQAFLAAAGMRRDRLNLIEMCTSFHTVSFPGSPTTAFLLSWRISNRRPVLGRAVLQGKLGGQGGDKKVKSLFVPFSATYGE